MSSHIYSAELTPDPLLRRVVLWSGAGATLVGIILITALPIAAHWRAATGIAWLLLNGHDLVLIAKGNKRCKRIRLLQNGAAEVLTPTGSWVAVTLLAGSIVLPRIAWLRFAADDGSRYAELIRGKRAQNQHWRRLQVIWRHLGAGD